MTEFTEATLKNYHDATILSDNSEEIPLSRKAHLAFGNFLNFPVMEKNIMCPSLKSRFTTIKGSQETAIRGGVARADGLLSKQSKIRPTVEQAQVAFSCAYNLYNELSDQGKAMRGIIKEAATKLGLTIEDDVSILDKPETYEILNTISQKFERQK